MGAFAPQAIAGGALGVTVQKAMRFGVARGLFSNEAGMGSTPHAHATAEVKDPCDQGIIAMMGVFIDTFIILTLTALVILSTGVLGNGQTGSELAQSAFNVGFGGVAGFIRPVLLPMAEGAIENKEGTVNEEHLEEVKGLAAAMQNFTWFFFQVLFVGGAGGILVQTTLAGLGYEVSLIDLAAVEIPVALFALVVSCVYVIVKDNRISKKYYGKSAGKKAQK